MITSGRVLAGATSVALWLAMVGQLTGQEFPAVPPPPAGASTSPEGVEVMTRGPVHEAYAQPVVNQRSAGLVIPKQPPGAIEEAPPDARPDEENVVWIPGYWSWDDDAKDFIWISGVWRVMPPNLQWLPGYWTQADGGWQWVSGTWTPQAQETVDYYPPPPETLEQGPSSPQPSVDQFWVPGYWNYVDTRYVWRPGYWAPVQPEWIWVPAHYVWTPRGYIFVPGYWDYPLASRGLIFCPVRFTSPLYLQPAYVYRPVVTVDVGILTFHMFAWPAYRHYCFGDYYGPRYVTAGIMPWYDWHGHHRVGYDPLWSYYSWHYRKTDPNWSKNIHDWHNWYERHPDYRPAHTLAAQVQMHNKMAATPGLNKAVVDKFVVARPLDDLRKDQHAPIRLTGLSDQQSKQIKEHVQDFRKFDQARHTFETHGQGGPGKPDGKPAFTRPDGKPGMAGPGGAPGNKPGKLNLAELPGSGSLQKQLTGRGPATKTDTTSPDSAAKSDKTLPTNKPDFGRPGARPGIVGPSGKPDLPGGKPDASSGKPDLTFPGKPGGGKIDAKMPATTGPTLTGPNLSGPGGTSTTTARPEIKVPGKPSITLPTVTNPTLTTTPGGAAPKTTTTNPTPTRPLLPGTTTPGTTVTSPLPGSGPTRPLLPGTTPSTTTGPGLTRPGLPVTTPSTTNAPGLTRPGVPITAPGGQQPLSTGPAGKAILSPGPTTAPKFNPPNTTPGGAGNFSRPVLPGGTPSSKPGSNDPGNRGRGKPDTSSLLPGQPAIGGVGRPNLGTSTPTMPRESRRFELPSSPAGGGALGGGPSRPAILGNVPSAGSSAVGGQPRPQPSFQPPKIATPRVDPPRTVSPPPRIERNPGPASQPRSGGDSGNASGNDNRKKRDRDR